MKEMNLNEWTQEIHENALNHGWWDESRGFAEVIALCHSELSEALEEDRSGRGMLYFNGTKPEGVAVELIDCIIRILDYLGAANVDVEKIMAVKHEYNKTRPYKHGKRY